jgi:hypothetical protein
MSIIHAKIKMIFLEKKRVKTDEILIGISYVIIARRLRLGSLACNN